MKKEGIQTRNRKLSNKTRRTAVSRNLRPTFYERPPSYYQNHPVHANDAAAIFSAVQTGLAVPKPDTSFYHTTTATGQQKYHVDEYGEGYQPQSFCGDVGGYATHDYLSAVASNQQYLSAAAAAGFHRHLSLYDLV